jgi:hypothetical protein
LKVLHIAGFRLSASTRVGLWVGGLPGACRIGSFISGIDTESDMSMESFIFYPRGTEGPSRAEKAEA